MTGRSLLHYEILDKLGEGGMGVVYKARDTHLDRFVALKLLPAASAERRARFVQEARAASALHHPNIVTIHDINSSEGTDFIAMEYVKGRTLEQLIKLRGLKLSEALKYATQAADALARAHAAGIVHRDLKPANVMVGEDGQVKVLDFGLAKLLDTASNEGEETQLLTAEGSIMGTVAYMSPEQAEGKRVDARSDIFSFGAMLYEMVTGRRAFPGGSKLSTLSAILRDEPQPMGTAAPPAVREIVARCLRKDPERRWQHMADLKVALLEAQEAVETGAAGSMTGDLKPKRNWLAAIAAAGLAIAAIAGIWWYSRERIPTALPVLTRLTFDSGLTMDPTLSADGKLLAFASDRAGKANLDIWVQQVDGGLPIQVTFDQADESEPSLSPDGTQIAFRSEREGGGIYAIPALGGKPRFIASEGRRPRFSPDGSQILYWTGLGSRADRTGGGSGRVLVAPAMGGSPRRIAPDANIAATPVWSPDGKYVLFRNREVRFDESDWWIVDARPGESAAPVRTGIAPRLAALGLVNPVPDQWLSGDRVLFGAASGDSTDIFEIVLSREPWRLASGPKLLTIGAGLQGFASWGGGNRMAFASMTKNRSIWILPIDANSARAHGTPHQLTGDLHAETFPSLSPDGGKLVFVSRRSRNEEVWIKDLKTGEEKALTATGTVKLRPILTEDGSVVVFGALENGKTALYVTPAAGGVPSQIGEGGPWDWAPGQRTLLGGLRSKSAVINLLNYGTGSQTTLYKHASWDLYQAKFSPDKHWVTFLAVEVGRSRLFITPYRGPTPTGESEWIPITDGTTLDDKPRWSPDGNLLYYLSERDGFRCLWTQPLDASKHPAGPPAPVYHFHNARQSIMNVALREDEISVARDKIAFCQGEITGNIWMMTMPQ